MSDLPKLRQHIEQGIEAGLHPGAVVYAARGDEVLADFAVGEARPGVPLTSDSLVLWMSSGKPIGATATLQLVERGLLALDEPVATYLPEFAAGGKQAVTVRHLLTHIGGFRWVDLRGAEFDWDEILRRICAAPLEPGWQPGAKGGYHPFTSWYVLGELVRRLDGRPFSQYVREELLLPLGMNDSWIGMPADQYDAYGDRLAWMLETERPSHPVHRYSTREGATACVPGGNGYGPLKELARFYHWLAAPQRAPGVLSEESRHLLTTRQRIGMDDATFRYPVDFSLGMIVNSAREGNNAMPYGYGPYAGASTVGHSGSQSSTAFYDPEHELVAAIAYTGMPGELKHQRRIRQALAALYEDLGLA